MKLNREQIRKLAITATLVLVFGGGAAKVSQAQDDRNKPAPESPPSETPSAPAESSRVSESSPSSDSSSSSSNNSSSSSPSNDSNRGSDGSSSSSNDSSGSDRRSESRRSKDDSSKHRGAVDGNGNRRERVPVSKLPVTAASENGASSTRRGVDRDRNRDWDGGRHRDGGRGHDRNRHRHRQDECYQVPYYDDTISYQAGTYSASGGTSADSLGAYDRGYEDGLFTGANDARRAQTYDPERSHFFDDTPGYQSIMGTRDVYRQAYRDGFLRGYREGYQNWQKYFSGGVFHR